MRQKIMEACMLRGPFNDDKSNIKVISFSPLFSLHSLLSTLFSPTLQTLQTVAWLVSTIVIALVIALPHEAYKSNLPTILQSSFYYAFARTAWSWSIGWI